MEKNNTCSLFLIIVHAFFFKILEIQNRDM